MCMAWPGLATINPVCVPPRCLPAAIRDAVPQLQRQANILLLALALSNAAALEQQGPPHIVATVEVTAQAPKPQEVKDWESQQLLVGGVGPAPEVPMRLRIRH